MSHGYILLSHGYTLTYFCLLSIRHDFTRRECVDGVQYITFFFITIFCIIQVFYYNIIKIYTKEWERELAVSFTKSVLFSCFFLFVLTFLICFLFVFICFTNRLMDIPFTFLSHCVFSVIVWVFCGTAPRCRGSSSVDKVARKNCQKVWIFMLIVVVRIEYSYNSSSLHVRKQEARWSSRSTYIYYSHIYHSHFELLQIKALYKYLLLLMWI